MKHDQSRRRCGTLALIVLTSAGNGCSNGRHDADERAIRAEYEQFAVALRAHDTKALMEHYAPNAELFVVDLLSDGQHMNRDEYRRHWDLMLAGLPLVTQATARPTTSDLQIEDLGVVTDGTLGYAHARLAGLLMTDSLRKIDGKWLIAQQHLSRSIRSVTANIAQAQTAANESSAVAALRTLNTALVTYASMFGKGFPSTLGELGGAAGLIDATLASGTKNGYTFVYAPGASSAGAIVTYTIHANPSANGGHRFFFTDETAIIRANGSQPADKSDPPLY
jgi:ketosteroid isomerase-like protein